jgi:hypothetical protein
VHALSNLGYKQGSRQGLKSATWAAQWRRRWTVLGKNELLKHMESPWISTYLINHRL